MANRQDIQSPSGADQYWRVYRSTQDGDLRISISEGPWFTVEQAKAFAAAITEVANSEDPSVPSGPG